MAGKKRKKPRLPRGKTPPPEKVHKDRKKEDDRTACRKFRRKKSEQ